MAEQATYTTSEKPDKMPRVLLLYFSFSGQTSGLLNNLSSGLKQEGVEVNFVKLRPLAPLRFPIGSIFATFKMMVTTSLRCRIAINEPEASVWEDYELIILAGPSWSYNPSGPIHDLLDRFGPRLFKNKTVLPIISCRGYWRLHWYGLKRLLVKCGASIPNRIIFTHPAPEPWRTLGVFLKIAGKAPERSKLLGRYYKRYGHSKQQLREAEKLGNAIGSCLKHNRSLTELDLSSYISLP